MTGHASRTRNSDKVSDPVRTQETYARIHPINIDRIDWTTCPDRHPLTDRTDTPIYRGCPAPGVRLDGGSLTGPVNGCLLTRRVFRAAPAEAVEVAQ
jgi:hypothetical protein